MKRTWKVTRRQLEFMSWLYMKGMSQRKIAEAVELDRGTVAYWMGKHPDLFPPREKRDESWWRRKLPEIEGLPDSTAARKLGCDRHTVWKWRRLLNGTR